MAGTSCSVCYEDSVHLIDLNGCDHKACQACLTSWFQTCQRAGQQLTCPQCRRNVDENEVVDVLGDDVLQQTEHTSTQETAETVDELTAAWLSENGAKKCNNCGAWIVLEEGCDAIICLCGYRFCWTCGNDECDCGHEEEAYYDNILRDEDCCHERRVASTEELQDLRAFIYSYREQQSNYVSDDERTCSSEDNENAHSATEPAQIEVHLAGNPVVNGIYYRDGYIQNACRYTMEAPWNGKMQIFFIFQCHVSNNMTHWYISIVPDNCTPGTSSDIDFYTAPVTHECRNVPPSRGWLKAQYGTDPVPYLEHLTEGEGGGGQRNLEDILNNSTEDDENDASSPELLQDCVEPDQIEVQNAGNFVVNGIYYRDGYFQNACRYTMEAEWDGKMQRFVVFQCSVSNNTKHWYISVVPDDRTPGTSSDFDFYTAPVTHECTTIPPSRGWVKALYGADPIPYVEHLVEGSNGRGDPKDILNNSTEGDEDDASSPELLQGCIEPVQIEVHLAGNPVVNGIYDRDGYFQNACRYMMEAPWNGKMQRFLIFQCHVSNNTKHWYISIVPHSGNPGTSSDIDFYTAPVTNECRNVPPSRGWFKAQYGTDPVPYLEHLTEGGGGRGDPGDILNNSTEGDEDDASSPELLQGCIEPVQIEVHLAGNPVVNGIYDRDGYFQNACRYMMEAPWNGKMQRFLIFQCHVSNNTKHWYISLVPHSGSPGTSSDIDFYTTPVTHKCRNVPPSRGWFKAQYGTDPVPYLEHLTEGGNGRGVP